MDARDRRPLLEEPLEAGLGPLEEAVARLELPGRIAAVLADFGACLDGGAVVGTARRPRGDALEGVRGVVGELLGPDAEGARPVVIASRTIGLEEALDPAGLAPTACIRLAPAGAELEVAAEIRRRLPEAGLSLSHEIGTLGMLERENAAVLVAALRASSAERLGSLRARIAEAAPAASVYVAGSGGTAMDAHQARRYPVLSLWNGATSAFHGTASLAGLDDRAVVSVGAAGALVGEDAARIALDVPIRVIRPENGEAAAAIGAARTPIGREVDCIISGDAEALRRGRDEARELARPWAVLAGGDDREVAIDVVEEVPLSHLPGDVRRLRVQAIAPALAG